MILYHGSNLEISKPDLNHSRKNVDFGQGFYVTPIYDQAVRWCRKYKPGDSIVSYYELNEKLYNKLNVLSFDSYSEEWLDFVVSCRRGTDNTDYDIVSGGIANDRVFNTIELYFENLIDKKETIGRLKYEKPNYQMCFRTQAALDCLHFEGSEHI